MGDLRFKMPQPHDAWTEPWDCTVDAAECPQFHLLKKYVNVIE